jgi:hypothetical protein
MFYILIVRPNFTERGNSTSLIGLYPASSSFIRPFLLLLKLRDKPSHWLVRSFVATFADSFTLVAQSDITVGCKKYWRVCR